MAAAIAPLNLATAGLITQLLLCLIIVVATFFIISNKFMLFSELFLFTATMGILLYSTDLFGLGRPAFGNIAVTGIHHSTAFLLTFILDAVVLGGLIFVTGGTQTSPFSPILFTLPALSIFLREPFGHVVLYLILVLIVLSLCFPAPSAERWHDLKFNSQTVEIQEKISRAYCLSTVLCLGLTTFVGWVTRPL